MARPGYVYTHTIAYIHKYSYSPNTLQAIFREKKIIKGPAPLPISHRIREYYIAQGTENPKIESSILEPLAQQASSLPLSQLSFYQIERIETPNLFPMVYHVLPIPSKKIFFFFNCMFYQLLRVQHSCTSTQSSGSVLPSIVETRDQNSRVAPFSF